MSTFTFSIVTPDGVNGEYSCDSVNLIMPDDKKGKNGGSIGIRKGHADSVIALDKGDIIAKLEGKIIFQGQVSGGFAVVKNGNLSVIAEQLLRPEQE